MNVLLVDNSLQEIYETRIKSQFSLEDSGFYIVCPENITIKANSIGKIKLGIKCEPLEKHGYWLLPRSSIYKTPLRLCNSVGLIDCQYRGEIMAIVDNISNQDFTIKRGDILFQLAFPNLQYFKVYLVDKVNNTTRGSGGFGSTTS